MVGEVGEGRDGFAHQRDLLRIIELGAKGSGGSRRGERAQRRPLFQHHAFQPGAGGVKGRGRAQDAAADDDAVGGFRDLAGGVEHRADIVRVSRFSVRAPSGSLRKLRAAVGRAQN